MKTIVESRMEMNGGKDPKKILVLRFSALGDVINATAAVNAVRDRYPKAEIDFLVAKGFECALENCPHINEIIVYDRGKNLQKIAPFIKLGMLLRGRKYDWMINCQRNSRSRVLARMISPSRTNPCAPKADYKDPDFDVNVLRAIGGEVLSFFDPELDADPKMLYWTTPTEQAFAAEFFAHHGLDLAPAVAFNPGGNWASKQWPVNNWIALGRRIVNELENKVLILGGPDETERAQEIAHGIGIGTVVAAGKTTFRSAATLMTRCRAVVSNDSGLMHLAASAGVSTIGLFGPTNGKYHGPMGPRDHFIQVPHDCAPCYNKVCPRQQNCMSSISPDQVFETLCQSLNMK